MRRSLFRTGQQYNASGEEASTPNLSFGASEGGHPCRIEVGQVGQVPGRGHQPTQRPPAERNPGQDPGWTHRHLCPRETCSISGRSSHGFIRGRKVPDPRKEQGVSRAQAKDRWKPGRETQDLQQKGDSGNPTAWRGGVIQIHPRANRSCSGNHHPHHQGTIESKLTRDFFTRTRKSL